MDRACLIPVICAVSVAWVSCAPHRLDLPAGPGRPMEPPDVSALVLGDAVTHACGFREMGGEAVVTGTVSGQPVQGRFRFTASTGRSPEIAAATGPAAVALDIPETGATYAYEGAFAIGPRHSRAIRDLIPLQAEAVFSVLTGCPHFVSGEIGGRRFGHAWVRIRTGERDTYLRRRNGAWNLVAFAGRQPGETYGWRADLRRDRRGRLARTRFISLEWNGEPGRRFDLTFTLRHFRRASEHSPQSPREEERSGRLNPVDG